MRIVRILMIGVLLCTLALTGFVAFGTAKAPPPLAALASPYRNVDFSDLPPLQHYPARDGASLAYREYPAIISSGGPPDAAPRPQAAVLLHGSSASSMSLHALAKELAGTGITVFALDLRGHGANQPHGDLRYIGQFDDDVADFARFARPQHPSAQWSLVGFSAGGGLALRIDGGPDGNLFDRYLLLAPFLNFRSPTQRQPNASPPAGASAPKSNLQSFAAPYTGRLLAIFFLDSIGIHWFDGLPVVAFAVPPDSKSFTQTYSMRLGISFAPRPDYLADIRNIHKPTTVIVGQTDEFSIPEQFAPVIHSQRQDVPVTILPGLGHLDLVTQPAALAAVRDSLLASSAQN
jgi:non-heme chloroperoxidase